jgi:hypothetical protein
VASGAGSVVVAAVSSTPVAVATPVSMAPRLPSSARAEKAVANEAPLMKRVTVTKVAASRARLLAIAELPGSNKCPRGPTAPLSGSHHQKDEQKPAF